MLSIEDISRKNYKNYIVKTIRKGKRYQPEVHLLKIYEKLWIMKDYYNKPLWVKYLIAPLLIQREYKIYQKLKGIKGVPKVYKKIDPFASIVEFIEGEDASKLPLQTKLEESFFSKLEKLIQEIHSRGVVHGDLGHMDLLREANIIISPEGEIYIIDFAGAFLKPLLPDPLSMYLYTLLKRHDLRAIPKFKKHFNPSLLTKEENKLLNYSMWGERKVIYWLKKW